MTFRRLLISPFFVALFVFNAAFVVYSPVVTAQKQRSAPAKKPARFYYVCPMHEDVTSKKPGKCPKCKMKLEKRRVKDPEVKSTDR